MIGYPRDFHVNYAPLMAFFAGFSRLSSGPNSDDEGQF